MSTTELTHCQEDNIKLLTIHSKENLALDVEESELMKVASPERVLSPLQKKRAEASSRSCPTVSTTCEQQTTSGLPRVYSKRKVTIDDIDDEDWESSKGSSPDQGLFVPAKGIRTYADGKPKPFFRGMVHGAVTAVLALVVPALMVALFLGWIEPQWWAMVGFFLGKGISYFASAFLHLYPFATVGGVTNALKFDLMAVPLSVWATSTPQAGFLTAEWYVHIGVGAAVTIINAAFVHAQFEGHIGLETPKGRSDTPRIVLIVLLFFWVVWQIGWHYDFQNLWVASVIIYVAAFACSIPVTNGHAREVGLFGLVPWHKVQVWGLHEDFHALLLLADICVACIGVRLLTNPDLDHILVQ